MDHRLVRSRIYLNLKGEGVKLVKKKQANPDAVRVKEDEFRLVLANKYAALEPKDEENTEVMNETVTRLISQVAIEVRCKAPRQPVGKLCQETNDLLKILQNMKVSNSRDQIEFAALSKVITKKKVGDIQNYNVGKIEEAVKYCPSMKSVRRKVGIGQCKIYALKDKPCKIISNFDDIVKAAEDFYTDLYSSKSSQATFIRSRDEQDTEAPSIISVEVIRALQGMTRGKAAGEEGHSTIDHINVIYQVIEKYNLRSAVNLLIWLS